MSRIRTIKKEKKAKNIEVVFRKGIYFLDTSLVITDLESGSADMPIVFRAYPNEKVILSGGKILKNWTKVKGTSSNVWKLDVPKALAVKHQHFRQLFLGEQRLPRAKSPNQGYYLTAGPNYASADAGNWGWFDGITAMRKRKDKKVLDAFCSFSYQGQDLKPWGDIYSAELQVFGSWEASWVTIKSLDTEKKDVWFNTPMRYPVGFFDAKNIRYTVENIREAMDLDNEWYYNKETKELFIQLKKGQDPNVLQIIAPYLDELVHIEGKGQKVGYINFHNITFSHAKQKRGFYGVSYGVWLGTWPKPALEIDSEWPTDFPPGYCGGQTASRIGAAIHVENAQYIRFDTCVIKNVGNYGINFAEKNAYCSIINSEISECGGGGVQLGLMNGNPKIKDVYPAKDISHHAIVANNKIHHIGMFFPAAVAVNMAQTHHNTIAHNEIHHCSYSGISTGANFGFDANYTSYNVFYANRIYKVGQLVNDGSGFYNLGPALGSVVKNNYISDYTLPPYAIGAGLYGLYFDEGSALYHAENNIVRNIPSPPIKNKGYQYFLKNDLSSKDQRVKMTDVSSKAGINPDFNPDDLPKDWFDQYPFIGVESENWPYTPKEETQFVFRYTNYSQEFVNKEYHWDTHGNPYWQISPQRGDMSLESNESEKLSFQIRYTGDISHIKPIPSLKVTMKDKKGVVFSEKDDVLFSENKLSTLKEKTHVDTKQTFALWHLDDLSSRLTFGDAIASRKKKKANAVEYKGAKLKLVTGKFASALHFDGNGYLESYKPMISTRDFKLDFWIKRDSSFGVDFKETLLKGPAFEVRVVREAHKDKITLVVNLEEGSQKGKWPFTILSVPYKPDVWNHVVASIKKGKINLKVLPQGEYVIKKVETEMIGVRKIEFSKIYVGGQGYVKPFVGVMDELFIEYL